MRASVVGIATVAMLAACGSSFAAGKLTPADIKNVFFNGQPFTAATPSGVKYKMIYTADGKMTRESVAHGGAKSEGTWTVTKDGFCTTWKGSQPNCYTLVSSGDKRWSVMKGSGLMAVWTR